MKRIVLTLMVFCLACAGSNAQGFLNRLKNKAKEAIERKVENRVEHEVDNAVNGTVDSALDKILSPKKKDKKEEAPKNYGMVSVRTGKPVTPLKYSGLWSDSDPSFLRFDGKVDVYDSDGVLLRTEEVEEK